MENLIIRTEEILDSKILDYYVETKYDEKILNQLESSVPCLLVGSRGVGKSFLFRVMRQRLTDHFGLEHILPVMVTFRNATLLETDNVEKIQMWMLSKITTEIIRAFKKAGIITSRGTFLHGTNSVEDEGSYLEEICSQFENSWRTNSSYIPENFPTIDNLLYAVEDICVANNISRVIVNIDEAAHVFIPAQQRQFFTMFRDLRSPYLKCNAAIYPGTTCFGDSFQPMHDAVFLHINRDIQDENYISFMKETVTRQLEDSTKIQQLMSYGNNFTLLAYAASGNPRLLFTTLSLVDKINAENTNRVFREFYRERIWSEHSSLAEKFPTCRTLIDWGRDFIENVALPELKEKNDKYIKGDKPTAISIWMNRDAPQSIKEAMRLLEYTGIVSENATGIRATRDKIGTRYIVNIGCLMSLEPTPTSTGMNIVKRISIKRMSEYGDNSLHYSSLSDAINLEKFNTNQFLVDQLEKSIDLLELTSWQKEKLHSVSIDTIGNLVAATEDEVMKAYYVGNVRARQMKNSAFAAVFEYLLG